MSIKSMSAVWELDLPPTQKLVLMALADHSSDTGECFPGMDGLSDKCSVSKSTIIRTIKKLEQNGYISVKRRKNNKTGKQYVNQYVLLFVQGVNMEPGAECQIEQKPGVIGDTITITKQTKPSLTDNFPDNLNILAWTEYIKHRNDLKVKPYKTSGLKKATNWLAKQGDFKKQQDIVDETIRNNWTGIFEIKDTKPRKKTIEEIRDNLRGGHTYEQ